MLPWDAMANSDCATAIVCAESRTVGVVFSTTYDAAPSYPDHRLSLNWRFMTSTYANCGVCGQVGGLVDALATHKQHMCLSTMLVVEYRIALPLSLEEYRVAQRYMVDRNTRDKGAHAPRIDVRLARLSVQCDQLRIDYSSAGHCQ